MKEWAWVGEGREKTPEDDEFRTNAGLGFMIGLYIV